MATQGTIIRPVDDEMCETCRFALLDLYGAESVEHYVFCTRKDCDNFARPSTQASNSPAVPQRGAARQTPLGKLVESLKKCWLADQ